MKERMSIKNYAARDENGRLFIYDKKPIKVISNSSWMNIGPCNYMMIEDDNLYSVKWEDAEPTEVEVAIIIKN